MPLFGNTPSTCDIVVIGASAGGIEALMKLVPQFPSGFPAAVFIVTHMSPEHPSRLPEILSRHCRLPVLHPGDGEKIKRGHIYVARPDHHLVIDGERVRLSRGPRENHFRPAIDVLFRSAAWSCGPRVTGVVLTGILDDGAAGLFAVKARGGRAVVQDPEEALFPDMPLNALRAVKADHCVQIGGVGKLLEHLVEEPAGEDNGGAGAGAAEDMEMEVKIALEDNAFELGVMRLGELTSYTCPECHGALARIQEGKLTRFRCHTGHAFTLNTLLVEVTKRIDKSLWDTLRAIEESQLLMKHLAGHLEEAGEKDSAKLVMKRANDAGERAKAVRTLVLNHEILSQEKTGSNGGG